MEKYYYELDKMSEVGFYNMWNADKYLVEKFGIDSELAYKILIDWIEKYSDKEVGSEWSVVYDD